MAVSHINIFKMKNEAVRAFFKISFPISFIFKKISTIEFKKISKWNLYTSSFNKTDKIEQIRLMSWRENQSLLNTLPTFQPQATQGVP